MPDKDSFDSRCPLCGREISFPDCFLGLVQACPYCFKTIVLPTQRADEARALPLPIATRRLILRPLRAEDYQDLVEVFSVSGSAEYTDSPPADEAAVMAWFQASEKVQLADPEGYINLGAQMKDAGNVVAYVSFYFADDKYAKAPHMSGAFTMRVGARYRNRGYGKEIAAAILEFGFEALNLHDVRVSVDSRNTPACLMLESIQMRKEGEFIENRYIDGCWINTSCYGLLGKEYHLERV